MTLQPSRPHRLTNAEADTLGGNALPALPLVQHGRFPVHGPLSVSPFSGMFQGALIGVVFGAVSLIADSRIPPSPRFSGWVLAGAIVGFIGGLFAPAFRYRGRATAVVWLAVSVAFFVVAPRWRLTGWFFLPGEAALAGAVAAITYALVGWEYIEPDPSQPRRRSLWPDILRALLGKLRAKSRST